MHDLVMVGCVCDSLSADHHLEGGEKLAVKRHKHSYRTVVVTYRTLPYRFSGRGPFHSQLYLILKKIFPQHQLFK